MRTKKNGLAWLMDLLIPLVALAVLVLFNLIRDPEFFRVTIEWSEGNPRLDGNLISIIDSASELAIIAMGMTLVTASCGGQDISVGTVGAIAGAIFVQTLVRMGPISVLTVIGALLVCCLGTILFKLFNGTLVAVFKIQPMIATLVLYSCGRDIGYMINGSATEELASPVIKAIGIRIPGVPVSTPFLLVVLVGLLLFLFFRLTNIRLYTQAVGVNQGAARLNGIQPTLIKLLSFVILGICVAVAAVIGVARMGTLTPKTLLADIEMDAILAVAIGGNSLGGGKFRLSGSVLGAYIIQMLTTTLQNMGVGSEHIRAYKAIAIIIIVTAGSPVIKSWFTAMKNRRSASADAASLKGVG
ncbi:MAG: ABC transporter permease [Clostridia bacterium]|nr:ABC transporter permease [Clostridia bacterium]MCR4887412.1 ABC transporter permease [Clostridiales bacterium]